MHSITELPNGKTYPMAWGSSQPTYRERYTPVEEIPEVLWGVVQEVDVNVRTPFADRFEIKPRPRGFPQGRKLT